MAKNAQRYLYSERVLAYRAKDWVAAIQTLLIKNGHFILRSGRC